MRKISLNIDSTSLHGNYHANKFQTSSHKSKYDDRATLPHFGPARAFCDHHHIPIMIITGMCDDTRIYNVIFNKVRADCCSKTPSGRFVLGQTDARTSRAVTWYCVNSVAAQRSTSQSRSSLLKCIFLAHDDGLIEFSYAPVKRIECKFDRIFIQIDME